MKPKFKEITIMNAFLCLCVIMVHVTSAPVAELIYGSVPHVLIFTVNKLMCFSVPAFIFLSGFKLHNKYKESKIELKKFYLGRLKSIVVPYIISVLVYFLYFYSKQWVLLSDLPEYIFLGTLAAHFYYIVIAVQFYLLFPLLMVLFSKSAKIFTAASLICTLACLQLFTFTYSDRFIGTYIFYFALGMLFSEYKLYEKGKKWLIISCCTVIVPAVIHVVCSYMSASGNFYYKYASIMNTVYVTCAICTIYAVCTALSNKFSLPHKISASLSSASYDIYLYHILALSILQYDIFVNYSLSVKSRFAITFVVIYGLSFIYAAIVSKIKSMKRSSK